MASVVGGHWLETRSDEYEAVRFAISAASQHIGALSKLEVWKIDNPDLNYKYERKSSGMSRLQSFVSADTLSSENTVEAVCSRGYYLGVGPNAGALFTTGVINLPNRDATFAGDLQFILFDVAVGRSFAFDGGLATAVIPPGYDSLYVPEHPLDRNKDGKFSLQEYQTAASFDNRDPSKYAHKYYIKDANQVMPKYVLRFRLSRAKNVRLDESVTSPSLGSELRFVDPVTLKTAQELMPNRSTTTSGNNSMNDSLDKRLMPIEKVFAQAVTDMNYLESDATSMNKRQWMDKQLAVIEDKVQEINLNYADIADAIDEMAQQAKNKLQQLVREKLELCLSMEIELRRQSEQLQWLQAAVAQDLQRYQHALVDAQGNEPLRRSLMLDFLKQWKQYLLLRNHILRTKPTELQALSGVHGDVKIQGDVQIFGTATGLPSADGEIADLIQRLNSEAAGGTALTSHTYVAPVIQRIVNQEMESIQRLLTLQMQQPSATAAAAAAAQANKASNLVKNKYTSHANMPPTGSNTSSAAVATDAVNSALVGVHASALQLPRTILKATAMGAGGRNQPLALHSILDLLKEEADKPLPLTSAAAAALATSPDEAAAAAIEEAAEDRALKDEFLGQALPLALGHETAPTVEKPSKSSVAPPRTPHALSSAVSEHSAPSAAPSANANDPATSPDTTTPTKPQPARQPSLTQQQKQQRQLDNEHIEMTLVQLQQFVRSFPSYSLSMQSLKKQKQLQIRYASGMATDTDSYKQFATSRIIQPTEQETIFFALPIFAQPPKVKCIFSTHHHRRSMEELLSRTVKNRYPTLLVIQSGDFRFGAFLSHPPLPTCAWSGNPSCFLFSLTLDIKIPFHARHILGDTNLSTADPCAMFVQPDRIFLGNGDLTIDSGLDRGTSELENSYGMGMDEHSVEAMCLLAGAPFFEIDELEVWCLQMN
eukprot:gene7176-5167_t